MDTYDAYQAITDVAEEGPRRSRIGIARFPEDGGDAAALLAYADRAMYIAKAANRALRQGGAT